MRKSAAFASVTGLLILGIAIGALAMHLWHAGALGVRSGDGSSSRRGFPDRMEQRLGLDAEQRAAIDEILIRRHAEVQRIRAEFGPAIREHMNQTEREILEVLTPQQAKEFRRMHARHGRRAERFLLGPPREDRPRRGAPGAPPPPE